MSATEELKNLPDFVPDHVRIGRSLDDLKFIRSPEVNLVLIMRPKNDKISSFIVENINNEDFPTLKIKGFADEVNDALDQKFESWCARNSKGCQEFVDELKNSINSMQRLNEGAPLAVCVQKTNSQTCPRWHRDFYVMRWICSYFGPGTEWTVNSNVNRENLRGENILKSQEGVYSILPFWCGLMKGELNNEGNGLIHRSPAVGEGVWRLLMKIDLLEE